MIPTAALSGATRTCRSSTSTWRWFRAELTQWLPCGVAALLLLAGALAYFSYVQHSRRIPEDEPQPWHEDGPRYFPFGAIGGSPAPLFTEPEFDELADSMGYFLSEESSARLDVVGSIQMTMRHGGVPALEFFRRHAVRLLLILEDAFAEPTAWNPIAAQFAAGMARRGSRSCMPASSARLASIAWPTALSCAWRTSKTGAMARLC